MKFIPLKLHFSHKFGWSQYKTLLYIVDEINKRLCNLPDLDSSLNILYENLNPVPSNIGGIKSGDIFSSPKTMQEMWDLLLYPYQNPQFSSFIISGQNTTIEIGDSVPPSKNFSWLTINNNNIKTNSISIIDLTNDVILASNLSNNNSYSITSPAISKNIQTSHILRISAENSKSEIFYRNFTISWQWRKYYGESFEPYLNSSQIKSLRVSTLSSTCNGTYSMNSGGYKYWVFPTSFPQPSRIYDSATNLDIALDSPYQINITNGFGITSNYTIYRSLNILGGSINSIII